jgi:hypothetical protein
MSNKFLNFYIFFYGMGALVSVGLYFFHTEGTIKFFSGEVSNTSIFWTKTVGSGDLLVAFICFRALIGNAEAKKLAVQSNFLYGVFHFGMFWYADKYLTPHKKFMSIQYIPSLIWITFTFIWWGILFPPTDERKKIVGKE